MFLHLSGILSTRGGGVGFPACITGYMTKGRRAASEGGASKGEGVHPGGSASKGLGTPPPRALQDTVNKRAVRIPLECNLVFVL